jgi:hypothetical protein
MAGRHGGGGYTRPESSDYDRLYQQPSSQYRQPPQGYVAPQQYPHPADPYQQSYQQQPYPQEGYYPHAGYPPLRPPRKKRRVFMWVFFAVQALFLIWIVAGVVSTGHTAPSAAEMAQYCGTGPKSVLMLYQNKADCMTHYSQVLSDAAGTGRGLGVALIVVFWIVVDFFLGLGYGIYRLATRGR